MVAPRQCDTTYGMNLSYVVLHQAKVPMYPQQHTTTINDSNVRGLPLVRLRHRVREAWSSSFSPSSQGLRCSIL
jgi:hypothetical protein